MKIRVDPLDKLFSQYIKLRDKVCQRCGCYSENLQTAHFFGRSRKSVRYDEDNACLLCFGDHMYFTARPLEFVEWFKKRLGEREFEMLQGRMRINFPKPDKKAITLYLQMKIAELENEMP